MHPQYARPKYPEYQDLFHAVCSVVANDSKDTSTRLKNDAIAEILETMNNLNLSDARSQYMLNKSQSESNAKRKGNTQLQYKYAYIDVIHRRRGPEEYIRYSQSTPDNRFWKDHWVRPLLYDWLICVAIGMKLSSKIYFRAMMICDLFLLENYRHLVKQHSENPSLQDFFLKAIAFMSIFIACKTDGPRLISCQIFKYFISEWPEKVTMSRVLELEVDIFNCIGCLTFDTYLDIIDDELVKNHFCSESFRLLRQVCEYVLMRTVVVDNECLQFDIQLLCIAVLINAIEIIHKSYQRIMESHNRKYNKSQLVMQMQLHADAVVKNSSFASRLVYSVTNDIRERLERFEGEEFYSNLKNICEVLNLHSIFSSEDLSSTI